MHRWLSPRSLSGPASAAARGLTPIWRLGTEQTGASCGKSSAPAAPHVHVRMHTAPPKHDNPLGQSKPSGSSTNKDQPMLVRDFIRDSLYSTQYGYFNQTDCIYTPDEINFGALIGRADYMKKLSSFYTATKDGWVTPVEIFKPYYAEAIARWVLSHVMPHVYTPLDRLYEARNQLKIRNSPPNTRRHFQQKMDAFQTKLHPESGSLLKDKTQAAIATEATSDSEFGTVSAISTQSAHQQPSKVNVKAVLPLWVRKLLGLASANETNDTDEALETSPYIPKGILGVPVPGHFRDQPLFPVRIVEMGAGSGALAYGILNFLQQKFPQVYEQTHYTIYEISTSLVEAQKALLLPRHEGHLSIIRINAAEVDGKAASIARASVSSNIPHFIIGLEVMDNLPHDKVIRRSDGTWAQVVVSPKSAQNGDNVQDPVEKSWLNSSTTPRDFVETAVPISDPVVQECLDLWDEYVRLVGPEDAIYPGSQPPVSIQEDVQALPKETRDLIDRVDPAITVAEAREALGLPSQAPEGTSGSVFSWIMRMFDSVQERILEKVDASARVPYNMSCPVVYLPTERHRLLKNLAKHFPTHAVLLADFDTLVSTEAKHGLNGPIVARKSDKIQGATEDDDTYLCKPGSADIFFPTDFSFLAYQYRRIVLGESPEVAAKSCREHRALQYYAKSVRDNRDQAVAQTYDLPAAFARAIQPNETVPVGALEQLAQLGLSSDKLRAAVEVHAPPSSVASQSTKSSNTAPSRSSVSTPTLIMKDGKMVFANPTAESSGSESQAEASDASAGAEGNASSPEAEFAKRAALLNMKQVESIANNHRIWSTASFMQRYAEYICTETRNGFNPLLEDYMNMSIFTASRCEAGSQKGSENTANMKS